MLDWENFEEVVKNIYKRFGKDKGVKIQGYGRTCKCKGKSGVEHQIDILTSHSDGIHLYKTGIECKYWNRKVNKDIVMKVREILEDCNIDKGVIITKIGFTKDAKDYAKNKNIELRILSDPFENSKDEIKEIILELHRPMLDYHEIRMIIDENDINKVKNLDCKVGDFYYLFPDGKIRTVLEIAENFVSDRLKKSKINDVIDVFIKFSEGIILKSHIFSDLEIRVKGVKIKGIITSGKSSWSINPENYNCIVMKPVSAGTPTIIITTKDGRIPDSLDELK